MNKKTKPYGKKGPEVFKNPDKLLKETIYKKKNGSILDKITKMFKL